MNKKLRDQIHRERIAGISAVQMLQAENELLARALEGLLAAVKTVPEMNNHRFDGLGIQVNEAIKAYKARQGIPRMVPDSECKQGKCGYTTTGCVGACKLDQVLGPAAIVTPN